MLGNWMNPQQRLGKVQEVADGLWALMLDGKTKGRVRVRDLYTLYKTQRELEADMQPKERRSNQHVG